MEEAELEVAGCGGEVNASGGTVGPTTSDEMAGKSWLMARYWRAWLEEKTVEDGLAGWSVKSPADQTFIPVEEIFREGTRM